MSKLVISTLILISLIIGLSAIPGTANKGDIISALPDYLQRKYSSSSMNPILQTGWSCGTTTYAGGKYRAVCLQYYTSSRVYAKLEGNSSTDFSTAALSVTGGITQAVGSDSSNDLTIQTITNGGTKGGKITVRNMYGDLAKITATNQGTGGLADDGKLTFSVAENSALSEAVNIFNNGVTNVLEVEGTVDINVGSSSSVDPPGITINNGGTHGAKITFNNSLGYLAQIRATDTNESSGSDDGHLILSTTLNSALYDTVDIFHNGVSPVMAVNGAGTFTGTLTAVGGSLNKATCWKTGGTLGYCSSVVAIDGSCTCN